MPRTIHVSLPDEVYRRLKERAEASGVTVTKYVKSIIAEHVGAQLPSMQRDGEQARFTLVAGDACIHVVRELVDIVQRLTEALQSLSKRLDGCCDKQGSN